MIDPRRLTENDKGREIIFAPKSGSCSTGRIVKWSAGRIEAFCDYCKVGIICWPDELNFASGTYQDGGAE